MLLSSIAPAFAAPPGAPASNTTTEERDSNAGSSAGTSDQSVADAKRRSQADFFIEHQDQVLKEVFDLATKLEESGEEQIKQLGEDEFYKKVKNGQEKERFRVEAPGLGHAEPTTIDGIIAFRVVHEKTGIAFILINESIQDGSKHLRQWIARQHRAAGQGGRPVFVIRLASRKTTLRGVDTSQSKLQYSPKPTTWRGEWGDFAAAIYVQPTKWDAAMGAFCAVTQAGLSIGLSSLQVVADPSKHMDYKATILAAIFASVIGTFGSTWKNFTNDEKLTKGQRMRRAAIASVSFAYILQIWSHGWHSISIYDVDGLLTFSSILTGAATHASIGANILINNYTRDFYGLFSRIRENTGVSRGELKVPIPFSGGKRWVTGVKQTVFEYQMIALIPFTLKLADLVHFSVQLPVLGSVAAGKFLFWLSPLVVLPIAVKVAKKAGYEKADEMEARWKDLKRLQFLPRGAKKISAFLSGLFDRGHAFACNLVLKTKDGLPEVPEGQGEDDASDQPGHEGDQSWLGLIDDDRLFA